MNSRHQLTRIPRSVVARFLACGALVLLVGCGAGQVTQTDNQAASVDGANADLEGGIAVRDALTHYPVVLDGAYPPGSDIPLELTIVNEGQSADTLVSVTTPVSPEVLVEGGTTIPAQASVISVVDEEALSSTPGRTEVPAGPLDFGEVRIVLTDINQTVRSGQNVEVTFVFENAGEATLSVPMAIPPASQEREPLEGEQH